MVSSSENHNIPLSSEASRPGESVQVGFSARVGKTDFGEIEARTNQCGVFCFVKRRATEVETSVLNSVDEGGLD
jgi:hypothetical protein